MHRVSNLSAEALSNDATIDDQISAEPRRTDSAYLRVDTSSVDHAAPPVNDVGVEATGQRQLIHRRPRVLLTPLKLAAANQPRVAASSRAWSLT